MWCLSAFWLGRRSTTLDKDSPYILHVMSAEYFGLDDDVDRSGIQRPNHSATSDRGAGGWGLGVGVSVSLSVFPYVRPSVRLSFRPCCMDHTFLLLVFNL